MLALGRVLFRARASAGLKAGKLGGAPSDADGRESIHDDRNHDGQRERAFRRATEPTILLHDVAARHFYREPLGKRRDDRFDPSLYAERLANVT